MAGKTARALREAIEELLRNEPGQHARRLAYRLNSKGFDVDKSAVNSVLYRHSDSFRHDGGVPPRWSLREVAPRQLNRAPHRLYGLYGLGLANWKAFEQVAVPVSSITLLYGENSSGKSSILQALLLLKQSWGYGDLVLEGEHGNFGWYEHVVHRHEVDRNITFTVYWGRFDPTAYDWSVHVTTKGSAEWDRAHPIAAIVLQADGETIGAISTAQIPLADGAQAAGPWLIAHGSGSIEDLAEKMTAIALDEDDRGFPDVHGAVRAYRHSAGKVSDGSAETLAVMDQVFQGVATMFDAIVHLRPSRTVPRRDIRMSWAKEHADYIVALFESEDLLLEVNEWLSRFEVPYSLEIVRYGDDEGDETFDLTLHRQEGGEVVQLRDIGFGVSQLLPIITQLLRYREQTILIEEPEAHVHPRLQSALADLFITSAQDYGNVLVVETHSEPILLRLQRRIAEDRLDAEDVRVHHVIREGPAARIDEVEIDETGRVEYQWPGGFFDDRMQDLVAIFDPRPDD